MLHATFAVTPSLSNVTYCSPGGVDLKMDVYTAGAKFPRPTPAVVAIHGGQWLAGTKASSVLTYDLGRWVGKGITGFSIDYRVGAGIFPAYVEDAQCAIQHIRANATLYGIDPDRIVVLGHSAGGHIAAWVALGDSTLRAAITYAAPFDLAASVEFDPVVAGELEWIFTDRYAASPINFITPSAPPFLIVHGTLDESIGIVQAQRMHDALLSAGVTSQLLTITNGGHHLTVPSKYKYLTASPTRQQLSLQVANYIINVTR